MLSTYLIGYMNEPQGTPRDSADGGQRYSVKLEKGKTMYNNS